jgi:hypothetical protein
MSQQLPASTSFVARTTRGNALQAMQQNPYDQNGSSSPIQLYPGQQPGSSQQYSSQGQGGPISMSVPLGQIPSTEMLQQRLTRAPFSNQPPPAPPSLISNMSSYQASANIFYGQANIPAQPSGSTPFPRQPSEQFHFNAYLTDQNMPALNGNTNGPVDFWPRDQ